MSLQRQHVIHMLRFNGVRMTGRMRKEVAATTLVHLHAARTIQRWFRARTAVCAVCPITLETVSHPCVSFRVSRLRYARYSSKAYFEFLRCSTTGIIRDPATNTPVGSASLSAIMRGLSHAGHNTRLIRPSMRLGVVNGIVECLENVVDALMSEILDDAVYTAAELEEWQLNMERAITALSSQNKAVARMKARQCLRSCECTRECDGCAHEAARAVITMLLSR
jgi:hypothetical protein